MCLVPRDKSLVRERVCRLRSLCWLLSRVFCALGEPHGGAVLTAPWPRVQTGDEAPRGPGCGLGAHLCRGCFGEQVSPAVLHRTVLLEAQRSHIGGTIVLTALLLVYCFS